MNNLLVLHSSALIRQWLQGVCRDSGRFNQVLTAASLDIAIVKFEHCVHNLLIVEDRLLDRRSRAWIVDRRHRLDEHILILHREQREQNQANAFTLEHSRVISDLEPYREALIERALMIGSNRHYEQLPDESDREDLSRVRNPQFAEQLEKVHPDSLLPYQDRAHNGSKSQVIVIGASTGGTEALFRILKDVQVSHPPMVMVQHMPDSFIEPFAQNLSRRSGKAVELAVDGMTAQNDHLYLIPGSMHGCVYNSPDDRVLFKLIPGPPVSRHRPSVNMLFRSAAMWFANRATGLLLTGMGDDGVIGLGEIFHAGGHCIIQDEESSVVFGMPGEARKHGYCHQILHLDVIAQTLNHMFSPPLGATGIK